MKNMNGRAAAFCAIFFVFAARAAFAVDFGGLVSNDSSFKNHGNESLKFDQQNSISLWLRAPFDKSGENYFALEGGYRFGGDFELSEDRFTNALDVTLLEVAFAKSFASSKINFRAGRFYFSDLSGMVFVQNADGIKFDFQNNLLRLSAYASYTGLLNSINVKIITARPVELVASGMPPVAPSTSIDKSKVYELSEKYIAADLALSFPRLFANQNVALELLGAFRLEKEMYHRMYATLGINGPIWRSLFYSATSTLCVAYYENLNGVRNVSSSNLTRVGVNYYGSKFTVGASGVYASGEQGGLSAFVGFTKNVSTYAYQDFLYSGIIKAGASVTFRPIDRLLFSAASDAIFNAAAGANFNEIEYFGFQYAVGATWQVSSDFQLGASLRQFIDKNDSAAVKKLVFGVSAALAF